MLTKVVKDDTIFSLHEKYETRLLTDIGEKCHKRNTGSIFLKNLSKVINKVYYMGV